MAEYAYLLGLIALGVLGGLTLLGDSLIAFFADAGSQMSTMAE